MGINKTIIRIAHFFGLMRDQSHIDDITFKLPTIYPEKDFDRVGGIGGRKKDKQYVIDDIKSQTYEKLNNDKKFKKSCDRVKQVYILHPNSTFLMLYYKRNTLYYPCESEMKIMERDDKLSELID